jgi:hypothetical protein
MAETNESLLNVINKSGFLFQARVEKEIKTAKPGNWEPIAHEHRWVDPFDGREGFIDLVLEYGIDRMAIECKKTNDAKWVFLIPQNQGETNRARLLWTYEGMVPQESNRKKISEWYDFIAKITSLESLFCIVRGQGENDTPMLERLSLSLLRSVESLANEELEYAKTTLHSLHVYWPVIITNTKLFACRYDPDKVDISTGQLSGADFEEIPLIRFRKNLSSSVQARQYSDLGQANLDYERTVFIINSNHIVTNLRQMKTLNDISVPFPWQGFL